MMKSGGRQFPAIISSKNRTPSPNSDLPDRKSERKAHRRRSRNPSSSSGIRLRKDGLSSGKRSGPATPLLRWKYNDGDVSVDSCKEPESGKKSRRKVRNAGNFSVSARKLAAGLWHLQLPEASVGGQGLSKPSYQLGFEEFIVKLVLNLKYKRGRGGKDISSRCRSDLTVLGFDLLGL